MYKIPQDTLSATTKALKGKEHNCLLYTSDAADDWLVV